MLFPIQFPPSNLQCWESQIFHSLLHIVPFRPSYLRYCLPHLGEPCWPEMLLMDIYSQLVSRNDVPRVYEQLVQLHLDTDGLIQFSLMVMIHFLHHCFFFFNNARSSMLTDKSSLYHFTCSVNAGKIDLSHLSKKT